MKTPIHPALRAILLSCFIISTCALPAPTPSGYYGPQNDPANPQMWAPPGGPVYPGMFETYGRPSTSGPPVQQSGSTWPMGHGAPPPWAVPGAPQPSNPVWPPAPGPSYAPYPAPYTQQPQDHQWHPYREGNNGPQPARPEPFFIPPDMEEHGNEEPLPLYSSSSSSSQPPAPPYSPPPSSSSESPPPDCREEARVSDLWHPYKVVNAGGQQRPRPSTPEPFIPPDLGGDPGQASGSSSSGSRTRQRGAPSRNAALQRGAARAANAAKGSGKLTKPTRASKEKAQPGGIRTKLTNLSKTIGKKAQALNKVTKSKSRSIGKKAQSALPKVANLKGTGKKAQAPVPKASTKPGRRMQRVATKPPISSAKQGSQNSTGKLRKPGGGAKKAAPARASTRREADMQKGGKNVK